MVHELPVVTPGGKARVVPEDGVDPYHDGVGDPTPLMHQAPGCLAGNPLRMAGAGGDLAVQTHGELCRDERQPYVDMLGEGFVQLIGLFRTLPKVDRDTRLFQLGDASTADLGVRV